MSTALVNLTSKLAERLDMGDNGSELIEVLKLTAFKTEKDPSDAQMTALMVVANQYKLNPWTKEIFAFPDKGGIVPVVGVDGWARIINTHQQFDGMDFESNDEQCTCIIYRKDRSHPTRVTEYLKECKRNTGPWQSHPKRMLRHKAMIQCARLAFGFTGIYDEDEAQRIIDITPPGERNEAPATAASTVQRKTKPAEQRTVIDADTAEIVGHRPDTRAAATTTNTAAGADTGAGSDSDAGSGSGGMGVGMVNFITKKLAEKGIEASAVPAEFGGANFAGQSEEVGQNLIAWIRQQ